MAKILAICGSVRTAATDYALKEAVKEAEKIPGIETEIWSVKGKKIASCIQCDACVRNKSMCIIQDDFQEIQEKLLNADALLIASPVYDMTITPQLGALLSRTRPCYIVYPGHFKYKPGGAIAVGGTRHGGQEFVNQTILNFYLMLEMFALGGLGGCYNGGKIWSKDNKAQGTIEDEIGLVTVRNLGKALGEATIVSSEGRKAWLKLANEHGLDTSSSAPIRDH